MPGGWLSLAGQPKVLRNPSRCEDVFYGALCSGVTELPCPHWRGLLDHLEKAEVPTQMLDGALQHGSTHDSGGHREPHFFSWGPLTSHQISETFCRKDVLAEEGE